jgi:DNA-binding MarR family transcriptional regulator
MCTEHTIRVNLADSEIEIQGTEEFVEKHMGRVDEIFDSVRSAARSTAEEAEGSSGPTQAHSASSEDTLIVPEYFGQWLHRFRGADLTEADQALIAGYFVQRRSEEEDFMTGEVTETLDEAGIELSNTSRSIRQLSDDGKAYPTRKDGRYQRFKVSEEGKDYLKNIMQTE